MWSNRIPSWLEVIQAAMMAVVLGNSVMCGGLTLNAGAASRWQSGS